MATKSIRVDAEVLEAVLAKKPHYIDNSGYLSDLLVKGIQTLDTGFIVTKRATNSHRPNGASVVSKDLIEEISKKKFVFSVPEDLVWCDELLEIYWKEGKKGAKTERAAKFLFEELGKIESAYGKQVVIDQLKAATAHRWESITALNYERFGLPAGTTSTSDAEVHKSNAGCYRDFTAERLERERLEMEAANA